MPRPQNNSSSFSEPEDLAEINMIPMIDVMLVLLIIFMVAAPLSISGIQVNLPISKAKGVAIKEDRIVLSIDSKGDYFIEKEPIRKDKLTTKLQSIFEFKKQKHLYIRGDRTVQYTHIIDAMSAARQAGIHKMAMLTTPPEK